MPLLTSCTVVGGVCAPVYLFFIPSSDPQPGTRLRARLREIDWIGAVLIAGMFLAGLMGISFGGTVYAWSSGSIITLFVLFGVLLVVFFVQQICCIGTTAARRLFPVPFLRDSFMIRMFLQTAAGTTSVFIPIYFIPLYFAFVQGDSALTSGVRLLPYVVPMSVVCVVNGYAMSYFGYYTPWYLFGGVCCVLGNALLSTIDVGTSFSAIYAYSALVGIGAGAYIQASFSVAQLKAPPPLAKHVLGLLTTAQLGGPAFALAVADAAFLNNTLTALTALLPEQPRAVLLALISGATRDARAIPAGARDAVLEAIVTSLRRSFFVSLVAGALTLIMALTFRWEKLFVAVSAGHEQKAEETKETAAAVASSS